MLSVRLLDLVSPVKHMLPEVEAPFKKQLFREKLLWTAITLFIYLICCQLPLYGIKRYETQDPLYWLRTLFASKKGTLMELGVAPIVISSMLLHVLAGTRMIDVNMGNKNDRELFQAAQKLFGLIVTLVQAVSYLLSGMYGPIEQLGVLNCINIVLQLVMAGVIVLLLDELLQKGYGLGSGLYLFIATNICSCILWSSLAPVSIKDHAGELQFEGALVYFLHVLFIKPNKLNGLYDAMFRDYAPNLLNFFATVIVVLVVNFFQNFRLELTMQSQRVRSYTGQYPIKMFYTGSIPVLLQTAIVCIVYCVSQVMQANFKGSFFVSILGQWQEIDGASRPIGGLAHLVTPPRSALGLVYDPIHFVFYTLFMVACCANFANMWIYVSGSAPKDVCRQLRDQDMTLEGGMREDSMKRYLSRYIKNATTFGGIFMGAMCIAADLFGAMGTGTGIVLAISIIYNIFEQVAKEKERGQDTSLMGF